MKNCNFFASIIIFLLILINAIFIYSHYRWVEAQNKRLDALFIGVTLIDTRLYKSSLEISSISAQLHSLELVE